MASGRFADFFGPFLEYFPCRYSYAKVVVFPENRWGIQDALQTFSETLSLLGYSLRV